MADKYTKVYNARAEPLFCSLNPLFYHVLFAVAVVVSSPHLHEAPPHDRQDLTCYTTQSLNVQGISQIGLRMSPVHDRSFT